MKHIREASSYRHSNMEKEGLIPGWGSLRRRSRQDNICSVVEQLQTIETLRRKSEKSTGK